ncbi:MAG: glutamine synthetase type III [Deltaproteobacteria bacterium CG11_big_fil_rev_8_21_14_0_20_45_16]|nr:MAG: glutamine synthetase type III [Deltaproteobacteria bacterium CG11_big_fil_rev_8_21_14_0_20_45_16]
MSARVEAVRTAISRETRKINRPKDSLGNALPVSEFFGSMTFGLDDMKEKLSKSSFDSLMGMVNKGQQISKDVGDEIAAVVKDWATNLGVTHFCHWFQPMTGLTAEKHDAFIQSQPSEFGQPHVIERISGGAFLQSEPDASSFPSGGMRNTFEARGYTAWDPKSPLFVMSHTNGRILCVPSAYIGYYGQALDNKTPLLRSTDALSVAATKFLKIIGDVDVKSVVTTVGAEQEYFLIDRAMYALRPDLLMTGRSLLGRVPTRNQQFEDHYFGSIPSRILAFMQEVEQEMYRLGVPLKTRHNEVAPAQYEIAPIFEDANLASDHNALLMDVLRRIANRHNLVCLLHEKPFAGINGSGKHNNWSIATNAGANLLDPGKTPHQNLRFLAVLATVLKAVHDHSDILRAGIASAGNDHRLGANEAPPAIISVFLGHTLDKICNRLEKGEIIENSPEETVINLGVGSLPTVAKDNTDRNRTSPFAFTGNKFEFRAVGGSASIAVPITLLNAAATQAFAEMSERLEKKLSSGTARDEAVLSLISEVLKETKNIRFEGNNYSAEWVSEAKKRGLSNFRTTPEALDVLGSSERTKFIVDHKILTAEELKSRHNVAVERYIKQIELEVQTMLELVDTYVLSAVEKELSGRASLLDRLNEAKATKAGELAKKRLASFEAGYVSLIETRNELQAQFEKLSVEHNEAKRAHSYADRLMPLMDRCRTAADALEFEVGDEYWMLPKYREMLFLR